MMEFLNWRNALSTSLQIPEERGCTFDLCNLSALSMSQAHDLALFGACASCMAQAQNLMPVIML